MASRLPLRKCLILRGYQIEHWIPFCCTSASSFSRFKSVSNKYGKNSCEKDAKSRGEVNSFNHSEKKDAHGDDTSFCWDDFNPYDYTAFSNKYAQNSQYYDTSDKSAKSRKGMTEKSLSQQSDLKEEYKTKTYKEKDFMSEEEGSENIKSPDEVAKKINEMPSNLKKKKKKSSLNMDRSKDETLSLSLPNSLDKKKKMGAQKDALKPKATSSSKDPSTCRKNCLGIQMLSPLLYDQLFSSVPPKDAEETKIDYLRSKMHLEAHQLLGKEPSVVPNCDFHLPPLKDQNLEQHFYSIAEEQCFPYKKLLCLLLEVDLPDLPNSWQFIPGWTRYNGDGTFVSVNYPDCRALVFDVEVCVKEGNHPTMAVAASDKYWYSWSSNHLIFNINPVGKITVKDLIPLEDSLKSDNSKGKVGKDKQGPRVVVGHNISYDRVRVSEQYRLEKTALRFVDTMSLHIAVSGLISEQRSYVMKNKTLKTEIQEPWMSVGCQNNLGDVYRFYCKPKENLKKEIRSMFVKGSLSEVRLNFQDLMSYCANDVKATHLVLKQLLPLFFERFPHPVTFSGMLEMGMTFLPVTSNWTKYTKASEKEYRNLERHLIKELSNQARIALTFMKNHQYKKDPWLWNLDWSVPKVRVKNLPGYPNWYRKLCGQNWESESEDMSEPRNMSTGLLVVPKLLRLTWDGFPLHYEREYGWGYLKPLYGRVNEIKSSINVSPSNQFWSEDKDPDKVQFPLDVFYEIFADKNIILKDRENSHLDSLETDDWNCHLAQPKETGQTKEERSVFEISTLEEKHINIGIPGVAFVCLPHKDGPGNRVGNPLAKDFLKKIEDSTLSSHHGTIAKLVLETNKSLSYWKNNRDRILSQVVIWNDQSKQESSSKKDSDISHRTGIILPMVVSAGTVTRRAVEPTWMTASNSYTDRIGSELKAMVEAPPGYKFVGADVDSQELWIAAVLGDAYYCGEHGSTALGWMTLQGNKSDGSDLHSVTANMAGISRDNAKIINYGRIYGAGMKFIERLLLQFNHSQSKEEAKMRASALFKATKGSKGWFLTKQGEELASEVNFLYAGEPLSQSEIKEILALAEMKGISANYLDIVERPPVWVGGTESHMFNSLEAIARSEKPKTPVLGARITRTLEPEYAGNKFMTSRVNWVVQSSAVDYLHLMLVCMQWLFKKYDIKGRFCISIHDEVRYLVASEDCYRAALALQIANLLTRSFFSLKLGFKDLPQSVAFFSSVDIDQVMRKEPNNDCVTPSNPDGLIKGYGIPFGESLDIEKILEITKGRLNKTN